MNIISFSKKSAFTWLLLDKFDIILIYKLKQIIKIQTQLSSKSSNMSILSILPAPFNDKFSPNR